MNNYPIQNFPTERPPGPTPHITIPKPIGSSPAALATYQNEGKYLTGEDRQGNHWQLKLTGPIVADIFLGNITNWNDPRITKINKGVSLPNLKITPAFRSDGSGDTYAFTDYLSRVSRAWRSKVGTSTQVSFPTGVGGKGNDGLTAIVNSTNGAISYISASYIIAHGLGAAALKNAAGRFE